MLNKQTHSRHNQTGAALAISLLILLMMTLIGVNSMRGTVLQERMASNTKDRNQAFQAAETALREAETYLQNIVTIGAFDGTAGLFSDTQAEPDLLTYATWTSNATSIEASVVPGSVSRPRYFIKQKSLITGTEGAMNMSGYGDNKGSGDVTTFLITARGVGASQDDDGATTEVILRSNYGRIF